MLINLMFIIATWWSWLSPPSWALCCTWGTAWCSWLLPSSSAQRRWPCFFLPLFMIVLCPLILYLLFLTLPRSVTGSCARSQRLPARWDLDDDEIYDDNDYDHIDAEACALTLSSSEIVEAVDVLSRSEEELLNCFPPPLLNIFLGSPFCYWLIKWLNI